MQTQANRSPHPLAWISGIALIVFSAVGVAAFMGWLPESIGGPSDKTVTAEEAAAGPHAAPSRIANNATSRRICAECGVIESTREIATRGQTTGIGVVGGAVVGGVLGHQIGGGTGKDIATAAGAVGGAVAGNEIEKRVNSTRTHEITVLFDDGSRHVFYDANPPAWHPGDRVRVINGTIHSET